MNTRIQLFSTTLETLFSVAEASSFSRAARQLNVRQSTVSRRIRNLEDQMGVSLLERYPHGVRLTAAGHAFLGRAWRSRDLLQTALAEAARAGVAQFGEVHLGSVWSFNAGFASAIIAAYHQQHPFVRLQFTELGAAELIQLILRREIDYAWTVKWHPFDAQLDSELLWTESLYLARCAGIESTDPQNWTALARRPFLVRTSDDWKDVQRSLHRLGGPTLDIHPHNCSRESLMALVAAGDGVMLVQESIARRGHRRRWLSRCLVTLDPEPPTKLPLRHLTRTPSPHPSLVAANPGDRISPDAAPCPIPPGGA